MQQDINEIFNRKILSEIKEYSNSFPREEVCGFIYTKNGEQKFYKCQNIASQKNKYFIINPEDFEMCSFKGKIVCVFHSHIKNSSFSSEDITQSYDNSLPYLLYNIKKDKFYYFDPLKFKNYKKYLGLDFSFGYKDCFSLVLNFYKTELNIEMYDPAINRELIYNPPQKNLICDRIDFKKWIEDSKLISIETKDIKDFKIYDMLVFDGFRTNQPTHFGIFLENEMFLHHKFNSKSEIEAFRGSHFKYFKYLFRHQNFI